MNRNNYINNSNYYLEFSPSSSENKSSGIDRGVSVITITCRPNNIHYIFENYISQSFENKEFIILLNNNEMDIEKYKKNASKYKNIKILKLDESYTLGQCKNYAIENSTKDYIAFFDDDDYYAPNFLKQSLETFDKVNADIVGKASFYIYFEESKTLGIFHHNYINQENRYVTHVADPSMIFKRKILEVIGKYPETQVNPDAIFQGNCLNYGYRIYSTDRYNFVLNRHPKPKLNHTWQIEEDDLLKSCDIIKKNITEYQKYVDS